MKKNYGKISFVLTVIVTMFMMFSALLPNVIKAQDTKVEYTYFIIEKKWEKDIEPPNEESQRPTSIEVAVEGKVTIDSVTSTVSTNTYTLDSANGWKKELTLNKYYVPEDDPTKQYEIQYCAYEATDLSKYYVSDHPSTGPLSINKTAPIHNNTHIGEGYIVNNSGVNEAPEGNIVVSNILLIRDADISYYDKNGNEYTDEDTNPFQFFGETTADTIPIYGDKGAIGTGDYPVIVYKGDFAEKEIKEIGSVVLTWPEGTAMNSITGEEYGLQIELSDIKIYSLSAITNTGTLANDRYVAIAGNEGNNLVLYSYIGPNYYSDNKKKDVVGVETKVTTKIIDSSNNAVAGSINMYIQDIDMPDFAQYYDEGGTEETAYFFRTSGSDIIPFDYVESVEVKDGVESDIYIEKAESTLLKTQNTTNGIRFFGSAFDDSTANSALKYLVNASSSSYIWRGANCGSKIGIKGSTLTPTDVTNTITNTSSLYKIEYYYMEGVGGEYPGTPNFSTVYKMIKPATEMSVSETDKTPSVDRGMPSTGRFKLDESADYSVNWEGTTDPDTPLVLKVYFEQLPTYRVIYHDNVQDTVWNKDDQTTRELIIGDNTPVFKGTPSRNGYVFLGWSLTEDSEIINVPELVSGDADYWAHWAMVSPSTYRLPVTGIE